MPGYTSDPRPKPEKMRKVRIIVKFTNWQPGDLPYLRSKSLHLTTDELVAQEIGRVFRTDDGKPLEFYRPEPYKYPLRRRRKMNRMRKRRNLKLLAERRMKNGSQG